MRRIKRSAFCGAVCGTLAVSIGIVVNQPVEPLVYDVASEHHSTLPRQLPAGALHRFGTLLNKRTVAASSAANASDNIGSKQARFEFKDFLQVLQHEYPTVFSNASEVRYVASNYSLLLLFRPSHKDGTAQPECFVHTHFHYDVVPVADESASAWSGLGPFAGKVVNGSIVGRGAFDAKGGLAAFFEALSAELATFSTASLKHGLLVTLSHDEELQGRVGTSALARELERMHLCLHFLLDEGGLVTSSGLQPLLHPDSDPLFALVGVSEKGAVNAGVEFQSKGGHASDPTAVTAAQMAAYFVQRIHKFQMAPKLPFTVIHLLQQAIVKSERIKYNTVKKGLLYLVAENSLVQQLIARALGRRSGPSAAMVRSTAAVVSSFSPKELEDARANVLPRTASVAINYRTLPDETAKIALSHTEEQCKGIAARCNITLKSDESGLVSGALNVSHLKLDSLQLIASAISDSYGVGTPTLPALTTAQTDSRHFAQIEGNRTFRFYPLLCNVKTLCGAHDNNEQVSVTSFQQAIVFYRSLLRQALT